MIQKYDACKIAIMSCQFVCMKKNVEVVCVHEMRRDEHYVGRRAIEMKVQ